MQFYLADWRHTHTFTQKAKKIKVVTSLCASSPSPTIVGVVAPGPDSSGVVGEPSPAPLVRTRRSTTGRTVAPPVRVSTNRPCRATSAGTSEEEGSAFYTEVEPFWREHTERPLGDSTRPSNHDQTLPFVRRGSALRSAPFLAPPLSLSLHPARAGGVRSGSGPRKSFPQNEAPPLHDL